MNKTILEYRLLNTAASVMHSIVLYTRAMCPGTPSIIFMLYIFIYLVVSGNFLQHIHIIYTKNSHKDYIGDQKYQNIIHA